MNRKLKRVQLICVILASAVAGMYGLGKLKPPPQSREIPNSAPLIEVLTLEAYEARFHIASQGTVRPRTETILSAEISGVIVNMSAKFVSGGIFRRGEELLRIDPSNYVVAVDRARASLAQRQIEFDGAQKLRSQGYRAESEYASAAAALAGAQADVANAVRNLERTRISLPYDGMVRAKEADLGQYVNPGSRLGVTFATDFAEVRLPLTDSDLAFIELPTAVALSRSGVAEGPAVELSAIQKGQRRTWQARIVRSEGVVDEKSRVTYAVARVLDPYQLAAGESSKPALPMGTFVAADITGMSFDNLVRVPRLALRSNNQLILVDADNRLRIRTVDVMRTDSDFAYLRGGAVAGDRISLTTIESPLNGMQVRIDDGKPEGDDRQRLAGAESN